MKEILYSRKRRLECLISATCVPIYYIQINKPFKTYQQNNHDWHIHQSQVSL